MGVGLRPPPSNPPLPCEPTKHASCLRNLMGWVLWIAHATGVVVVGMPLWVTSGTMQVDWAIHYRQSLIKKIGILAKVTMGMR